jgi:hypothetical protein
LPLFLHRGPSDLCVDASGQQAFNLFADELFCRLIAEVFLGCKKRGAESLADRSRDGLLERTDEAPLKNPGST